MPKKNSLKFFISYSHKDRKYKTSLLTHLKSLELTHNIDVWHDGKILAGDTIESKILTQLDKSDVILLLISPNFLASSFCTSIELNTAIQKHKNNECIVVPVIISESIIDDSLSFSKLMRVPEDGKPIQKYKPQNNGYINAVAKIKQMIDVTFVTSRKPSVIEPSKPITIDLYQNGKLKPYVIDDNTWTTIITIKDRITDFQKIISEKLIDFVIDYKNSFSKAKREMNPKKLQKKRHDEFKKFILEISTTTRQWLFKDVGVRIHFRILNKNKDSYIGFIVVDGKANKNLSINYANKITPISSTSGMIYHSAELDSALIKSKNPDYHNSGKNDDKYVDYITSALKLHDICNTPNPLMSMGISIEKEFNKKYAPYLIALVFLNFDIIINNLITIFCNEISKIDKDFDLTTIIY